MSAADGKKTLLVIDDDRIFAQTVADYFNSGSVEVLLAYNGAEGLKISARQRVDVILLDQKLPDGQGQKFCPALLQYNEHTKIIFITAYPSFDHAVAAIKAGAHDYLSKPFELEELELALKQAWRTLELERVEQLSRYRQDKESEGAVLIGAEGGLAETRRLVELAAKAVAPVLVTGETGTGKNVAARAIHYHSAAPQSPFIGVNCAALPENLIEAELFGFEKGAFTGAAASRKGVFEMAEGGTLFLDEIGSMPWSLQSKLLGVIEDKKIKRLGGETLRPVAVRIIAATNTALEAAVQDKSFRQDLYYRLNVIRIHLPPLQERRRDLPALCEYLLKQISQGKEFKLAAGEMEKLAAYPWPGNVRELKNVLERAALLQPGPDLRPAEFLSPGVESAAGRGLQDNALVQGIYPQGEEKLRSLEEIEKDYIRLVLERLGANYTHSARTLGISLSTLKRKVKEYGLV